MTNKNRISARSGNAFIEIPSDVISHGEGETEEAGRRLARRLREGDVVFLEGELGAGKTCFVRGIVSGLHGTSLVPVKSPSYTLLNIYEGRPVVYHFDFYRLEDVDDLESLGLNDYWGRGVCVVEWPRSFCRSLPGRRIDVIMSVVGEAERRIMVREETGV